MKTKLVFGSAHTPEAIEKFQSENAEKIEEMIVSGALDRPVVNALGATDQNPRRATRQQRKAA